MRRIPRILPALVAVALVAAACGDDDDDGGATTEEQSFEGESLEVAAVFTGAELERFELVMSAFEEQTGATVNFTPTGDDASTFYGTRVEGGAPPDVGFMAQQGVLVQFADQGALKPIPDDVVQTIDENFAGIWKDLATVNDQVYGVYYKAANKSTMWYRVAAFDDAGVEAPTEGTTWTWDEYLESAQTIADSGVAPVAIGGADGWTLTDWFENVYLSQAGPDMYDQLSTHEIPWTDPTVVTALETLAELWGNPDLIAPNPLQTAYPDSVLEVFSAENAAMVYEGDFVANEIAAGTEAVVGEDALFFPFPTAGDNQGVVGGGDVAVAFTDRPVTFGFINFLATPEAAEIWASEGGFTSPNQNVDLSTYADDTTRASAQQLIEAGDNFRFDLSDLAPAAFGGTTGSGMWGDLQEFLGDPSNPQATAEKLEADAAAAYGN